MRKRNKRLRRREKKDLELDINSLLDILVILLVFLLKSYSASQLEVKLPKDLVLPVSQSKDLGEQAPVIKVSKNGEVWVNNNKVVNSFEGNIDSQGRIKSLYNKLLEVKGNTPLLSQSRNLASEKNGDEQENQMTINLIFDQNLTFDKMEMILHTTALAGYGKYKFLVQEDN